MRRIIIRMLAVLALALLVSCDSKPKPPLVFGANIWPGYEPVYLARELGYLPATAVHLAEYGNASEVLQAFRNHTVHLAGLTLDEALKLRRDIPDLKIVLLFDASNGADAIIAQSGITEIAQLNGRRVGVENTALGTYFLSLALKSVGMQMQQLEIVPLPVDEQEAAFRAHKVDAVVTFEPVKARLLAAGGVQLFDSSRTPGKILDVLVTRDEYISQYHGEMVQFLQSWRRALDYLQAEPAKAVQAMAGREHLDAAQFVQAMRGLDLYGLQRNRELLGDKAAGINVAVDEVQRFMLQNGLLQIGVDAATLADDTLLSGIPP